MQESNPDGPAMISLHGATALFFGLKTIHIVFCLLIIVLISKAGHENGDFLVRHYGSIGQHFTAHR
jgi:hypothetical protein